MDLEEDKSSIPMIIGLVAVAALVGGGVFLLSKPNKETNDTNQIEETSTTNNPSETTTSNPPVESTNELEVTYSDGEYSSVGTYTSPAGAEEISVTLTLKNDIITELTVEPKATNPTSVFMQNSFTQGINEVIVGKNIDDVEYPGVVNGSSLTGNGFIEAIELIKADATV